MFDADHDQSSGLGATEWPAKLRADEDDVTERLLVRLAGVLVVRSADNETFLGVKGDRGIAATARAVDAHAALYIQRGLHKGSVLVRLIVFIQAALADGGGHGGG